MNIGIRPIATLKCKVSVGTAGTANLTFLDWQIYQVHEFTFLQHQFTQPLPNSNYFVWRTKISTYPLLPFEIEDFPKVHSLLAH